MPHLAVARFWFEGNRYSPRPTTLADFRRREWHAGPAALEAARGTGTELAAVAEFAEANPDWQLTVLRCCAANPGGPIEAPVFVQIGEEIAAGLRGGPFDAVYLSLHGAAVVEGQPTPERALVQAVRNAAGRHVPVAASFDLHANAPPVDLLDFSSAYRTYPHVDMRQTAERVLAFLAQRVQGLPRPAAAACRLNLLLPSFNMRTDGGADAGPAAGPNAGSKSGNGSAPMAEVLALARALESPPVREISVYGGFPYAGGEHAGASVAAYADSDGEAAAQAAVQVAHALRERAARFAPQLLSPAEGVRRALASPMGLVAVTDPADNPYSGGAADTPALFKALIALRPNVPTVFAYFADAEVAAAAHAAGVGSRLNITLGAKASKAFGRGVPVAARVLRLAQARFTNTGPMEHGMTVDLGASAVLDVDGIAVIVTTHCGPANDPAFFAAHGIDLVATRLLCVKAKNHFRAAFAERCAAIIDVDCPGPAMVDVGKLRRVFERGTS